MDTFAEIIGLWPSTAEFAKDVNATAVTARAWKNRNSIPGERWLAVVNAANRRGYSITLEQLASIAALSAPLVAAE